MILTSLTRFCQNTKAASHEIRWQMLVIFAFFSIVSTSLIGAFSVALVNVVVRRETAYLLEERIRAVVESNEAAHSSLLSGRGAFVLSTCTHGGLERQNPAWLHGKSFSGIVMDRGRLEIRWIRGTARPGCPWGMGVRLRVDGALVRELSAAAGLELAESDPIALHPYRVQQGMLGEIAANFIPGTRRPVPVVVTIRDWQTGQSDDWVLCQVHLSYARTLDDLSHMGLRPASWVMPLVAIAFALALVYICGFLLSVRLSQEIVAVVDNLSHAARQVGKGDFSVQIPVRSQSQLGALASSFNSMARDLGRLHEQEQQTARLEWEIALAREVQQHLYGPRKGITSGSTVWGINTPARMVSGDLFEFFPFSSTEVGILCADVSGKGVAAALMMSHLHALIHARLLALHPSNVRPDPGTLIASLNRDLQKRFGQNRFITMLYGEFDRQRNILRYVNAGHCPPILVSPDGTVAKLPNGNLPVGLFPEVTYDVQNVSVPPRSTLVFYTDGVTDALNCDGEDFGEERLLALCRTLPTGNDAEVIGRHLSTRVSEWAVDAEQTDDLTLLVLAVD